ncbi:MAG: GNAT family N-acetyltransferase [Pyrinomonadaceae bacterium]
MRILQAQSAREIQQVRELFGEYVAWLGINLCFQNYDKEVAELPGDYALPSGRLLLALADDGEAAGCAALRDLADGVCEMKRLFVRPDFRGQRLGWQMAEMILAEARAIGYEHIRLDTLPGKMDRAIVMYRTLGFKDIAPYYNNPVAGAAFMELKLT